MRVGPKLRTRRRENILVEVPSGVGHPVVHTKVRLRAKAEAVGWKVASASAIVALWSQLEPSANPFAARDAVFIRDAADVTSVMKPTGFSLVDERMSPRTRVGLDCVGGGGIAVTAITAAWRAMLTVSTVRKSVRVAIRGPRIS